MRPLESKQKVRPRATDAMRSSVESIVHTMSTTIQDVNSEEDCMYTEDESVVRTLYEPLSSMLTKAYTYADRRNLMEAY